MTKKKPKQAFELIRLELKCDTPSCDYRKTISGNATADYIGTQCPKCDAVLLTKEDHEAHLRSMSTITLFNALFGPFADDKPNGEISINPRADQTTIKYRPARK